MNAEAELTLWRLAGVLGEHGCQWELAEDRTGFYVCCDRNTAIRLTEWFNVVDKGEGEYFALPIAV